jgi:hypothetical protein
LGSFEAIGKQAILSGNLEVLTQTEFTPALRPWAEGARAWLMAQDGQAKTALKVTQSAREGAPELVQSALEILIENLTCKREVGPYQEWLEQFVQATLSQIGS